MKAFLRKAINVKAMLRRKYYKNPTKEYWNNFRIQRNKVTKIKRNSIKTYFSYRCDKPTAKKWRTDGEPNEDN